MDTSYEYEHEHDIHMSIHSCRVHMDERDVHIHMKNIYMNIIFNICSTRVNIAFIYMNITFICL